eukprot:Rhum_TRINITY_DN15804_c0_g1::Rhum_TRINITY_DN15804_c0_g1_i1::g.162152::m.162152
MNKMSPVAALVGIGAGLGGIALVYKGLCKSSGASSSDSPNKTELYRLLPAKGSPEYREVSAADLRAHDFPAEGHDESGEKRAWLLLYGVIIDITQYFEDHPGGAEILADQVRALADWAASPSGPPPDADEEYEPYHDISVSKIVAGKLGIESERPIYVGHLAL